MPRSKSYVNATIRIRHISEDDLNEILELVAAASRSYTNEDFLNTEDQPQEERINASAMSLGRARLTQGHLDIGDSWIDSAAFPPLHREGDVNYGPAPCPRCGRYDDFPCKVTRSKDPDAIGKRKKTPHPERIAANTRKVLTGTWKCLDDTEIDETATLSDLRRHLQAHPQHRVMRIS